VFRGSWWTKQECRRDVGTIAQLPEERPEHRAVKKECSNGGGNGLDTTVVHGGRDDAVGHHPVGSYYTVWYNNPEDVWRYYTEDAVYSVVEIDGTGYEATVQTQIRELIDDVAAPKTKNDKSYDGDCRSVIVQSVVTVRTAVGRGDDGDVHAILSRRVHSTHVVRRGLVRGDVKTRW